MGREVKGDDARGISINIHQTYGAEICRGINRRASKSQIFEMDSLG